MIRLTLSSRQAEVLAAFRTLTEAEGMPPTIRALGEHLGLKSSSTINNHLVMLARKGYLRHVPYGAHAYRLGIGSHEDGA